MFRYYQFINWSKLFFLDPDGIIFAFDENKRKKEKREAKRKKGSKGKKKEFQSRNY